MEGAPVGDLPEVVRRVCDVLRVPLRELVDAERVRRVSDVADAVVLHLLSVELEAAVRVPLVRHPPLVGLEDGVAVRPFGEEDLCGKLHGVNARRAAASHLAHKLGLADVAAEDAAASLRLLLCGG